MYHILLILLLLASGTTILHAHPTSFKGSVGVMGYHSPGLTHNQINYSKEYWLAFGIHHYTIPNESGKNASFASSNFLLKRWNGAAYQGNLYAVTGVGQSSLSGNSEDAGLMAMQFDIEDRKYYFLTKASIIATNEGNHLKNHTVRLGIAPYVENFDGIHSWLILDFQETEFFADKKTTELTPTLRVFYKNLLFEIGQSFSGETKFNYISHF